MTGHIGVRGSFKNSLGKLDYVHALVTLQRPEVIETVSPEGTMNEFSLYSAAEGYPSNFFSDTAIAGELAEDDKMIAGVFEFGARNIGTTYDSHTGEEPGKVFHELPGVELNGYNTAYSRGDTTALFLIAAARLAKTQYAYLIEQNRGAIDLATSYVLSHLKEDDIFYEDPSMCGAERFALSVTNWKDSKMNDPVSPEPIYPIAFSLMHFTNAAALREIGMVVEDNDLVKLGNKMTEAGIQKFWNDDHFVTAVDGTNRVVDPPSSDSLYSLRYIEPSQLPSGSNHAKRIQSYMQQLETAAGYRTALPALGLPAGHDEYHTRYVWTHEQGMLHKAASKHNLIEAQEITTRITEFFGGCFPELVDPIENYAPAGNKNQLWAIAIYAYFYKQQHLQSVRASSALEHANYNVDKSKL